MADLRLTPQGHPAWAVTGAGDEGAGEPAPLARTREAFARDWREGLFALAADKVAPGESPTLRFFQRITEGYLTEACHQPPETAELAIEPPSQAQLAQWVLSAPPMTGGEYLDADVLAHIWSALDGWAREQAREAGGAGAFLETHAPKWRQVGRVTFHLAENKKDPDRPFAFLATYATGFGAGGKLKHLPLGRALEQYAGAKHRAALVKLLTPVHEAAQACPWVAELVESGRVYHPQTWTPEQAHTFLTSVPQLEASGLAVRVPDWWKKRPRPRVQVTVGEAQRAQLGTDAMLDFDVQVALGGEPLSPEELQRLLSGDDGLVFVKGQWVELDRHKLQQALEHWQWVQREAGGGELSFVQGMRLLAGAPADLADEPEADPERAWVHVEAGSAMRELLEALHEPGCLEAIAPGAELHATLRPYQREGVAWLDLLTGLGLGACLADDMGLGKTIQVLALLLVRRRNGDKGKGKGTRTRDRRPSLLVVPASLLANWRREAERFAPSLALEPLHPAETGRERLAQIAEAPERQLAQVDLAVTSYSMLARQPWLEDVRWELVILDEAQAIKNPGTRQSKAVRKLDAGARIALTGTPVENRIGELWSLFDFLNPGLLGSRSTFKSFVQRLHERGADQYGPLRRLVGPYILRRLKTDRAIIDDLPDKTETVRYCGLTKAQVRLYDQTVRAMRASLDEADGMARRGLVLQTLMRLKQICNHPSQLRGDGDYRPEHSGKLTRLTELCDEIAARQQKVLVFTQFREVIDPLAEQLAQVFGRPGLTLHGGTGVRSRRKVVERFQEPDGPPFFVLSLKAGGTGLNLTAASHVIHFDRWWNPAVEDQATDRAFRIGQRRNVLVHKLVTRGTLEERIDAMIEGKRGLAKALLPGDGEQELKLTELSDEELLEVVRLDAAQAGV